MSVVRAFNSLPVLLLHSKFNKRHDSGKVVSPFALLLLQTEDA